MSLDIININIKDTIRGCVDDLASGYLYWYEKPDNTLCGGDAFRPTNALITQPSYSIYHRSSIISFREKKAKHKREMAGTEDHRILRMFIACPESLSTRDQIQPGRPVYLNFGRTYLEEYGKVIKADKRRLSGLIEVFIDCDVQLEITLQEMQLLATDYDILNPIL